MSDVIGWALGILLFMVVVLPVVVYLPWRFVCLFRRFCRFKACLWRCEKCPYPLDDLEKKEHEETIKELREQLEEYRARLPRPAKTTRNSRGGLTSPESSTKS